MKQLAFLLLLLPLLIGAPSCKKYPEGPAISLRTKTARVANEWEVEKSLRNGVDQTEAFNATYSGLRETYTKDGVWTYSYTDNGGNLVSGSGEWEFEDDDDDDDGDGDDDPNKSSIERENNNNLPAEIHLLKLQENEMWYWYKENNDRVEVHLKEKK
ncbi:MAG: hypothetical protein MUC87_19475 [Bacteroidia bacterium]|jgi:hypothetical protein|nr:hypothetical protein [Bacteroidia bacterium]